MSAALAMPFVMRSAEAVAEPALPLARPRALDGLAFYRRHTEALLRRYLATSMELGRTPCILGTLVFRGRVSSYRMQSFEDLVIFLFDVEKCLKQLDRVSREIVAHIALEDYSPAETASLVSESLRTVTRIYGESLDRLTRMFLDSRLLEPRVETGSYRAPAWGDE